MKKTLRFIRKIFRKIYYHGNKYKCNICKSNVRIMKPYGIKHEIFEKNTIIEAGYRKNCNCPVCGCKDRIRMVYFYLDSYTNIFTAKNCILHFAPECEITNKIKKNKLAKYYDCDIREKGATYVADIRDIPFPDNKFDYIICNQVLEHIVEEKQAINELKRVVKPKGKIIITVPICISSEKTIEDDSITTPEERLANFCKEDHVRLYGRDFKERLEKYGLKVEEWCIDKHVSKEVIEEYALTKGGLIYIATK